MYQNKIQIFNNIIDLNLQNEIKNLLLSNNFPWYFIPDVTNKNNKQKRPAYNIFLLMKKR